MPRFGFLSKLLTLASNLSNTFLAVIEPYSVSTKSKTSFNCLEASNDHSISILVPESDEIDAFVNEIPREALAASVEMALKDHDNGNTISHSELMSRIKAERHKDLPYPLLYKAM